MGRILGVLEVCDAQASERGSGTVADEWTGERTQVSFPGRVNHCLKEQYCIWAGRKVKF
jgi:hypothetical protein